jgi:hypothetical protein
VNRISEARSQRKVQKTVEAEEKEGEEEGGDD